MIASGTRPPSPPKSKPRHDAGHEPGHDAVTRMPIRFLMPAILRRRETLGQSTTKRRAADAIDRRGLIRGAASLGALGLLPGCDVSEEPPVQSWLGPV